MHAHSHIHTHIYTYTHTYIFTYKIHIPMYIHIAFNSPMHKHIHIHIHIHIHMHIHIHIHTYIYIYIHIHIHTLPRQRSGDTWLYVVAILIPAVIFSGPIIACLRRCIDPRRRISPSICQLLTDEEHKILESEVTSQMSGLDPGGSEKFVIEPGDLVCGEFKHAAKGFCHLLNIDDDLVTRASLRGTEAIEDEVKALGSSVVSEQLHYILQEKASEKLFDNGVRDVGHAGMCTHTRVYACTNTGRYVYVHVAF
jgi:hypothetical protein